MPLAPRHHNSAVPAIASNNLRRDASQSLPSAVQTILPSCAQPCLASFISAGYSSSVCPIPSDIFCLCSHYDNGGFTLGEGALSCIKLSCSTPTSSELNNAYDICNAQSNHVTPTHSTLSITAVLSSVPTTAVSSSLGNPSSSSGTASSALGTITSAASTPTSTAPQTSAVVASVAPEPTETGVAASHKGLSTAQTVGIVVASIASLVLVAGAIALIGFCIRRKRLRSAEEPSLPFESDEATKGATPEKFGLNNPILYPPKVTKDPRGGYGGVGIARASQYRAALEEQSSGSDSRGVAPGAIGVAISPEGYDNDTPVSGTSTCTTSRLLPEKPAVIPEQQSADKRPTSNFSQATVFEEDHQGAGRKVENFVFPVPPSPVYSRYPNENPPVQIAAELGSFPERRQPPPLTLKIPPTVPSTKASSIAPPRIVAVPPPKSTAYMTPLKNQHPSKVVIQDGSQNSQSRGQASQPIGRAGATRQTQNAPLDQGSQQGKSHSGKHASDQSHLESNRDSCVSDTSFESLEDNPTPPEETAKKLSPVEESPISSIRYPKVPRSSNQIVPRRSPTGPQFTTGPSLRPPPRPWRPNVSRLDDATDSSSSTSTLLAKRRGENAAVEIERRLGLPHQSSVQSSSGASSDPQSPRTASSSNTLGLAPLSWQAVGWRQSRFASALRNRVPVAEGGREVTWIDDSAISPTTVLRSPIWEPRLTPTRRGEDLMLSVT
ncbi:hypothetical protein EV356DRAFT_169193 [Viridothelium virens]|uniref:CFEM domain-containing protein n=1 Tax=Viridothelium virens TaxID=1048519 RepID=A0A6A6HMM2_VIRVR|nr:hypothetical protein EV356DRAFT_169193 [Viridothelium virens]